MSKFYRTLIEVEVLSEDAVEFDSLQDLHNAIVDGDCSGVWGVRQQEQVDGPTMARLLVRQGSDPEWFGLDADGHKMDPAA